MLVVVWTGEAKKDLKRLDRPVAGRIVAAVDRFAETGAGNVTQLRGEHAYRIRVGDWRAIFTIDETAGELIVHKAGHRRNVYE